MAGIMLPAANVTDVLVVLTVPAQVVLAGPEISKPPGNGSTSGADNVAAPLLLLLSVMVSVDTPPLTIVAGLKALPSVGAFGTCAVTVRVAMAGDPLLPLGVCKAPAGIALVKFPAAGAETFTVTLQELLAAIVLPVPRSRWSWSL